MKEELPKGLEPIGQVMSNFYHGIEEGAEEALREGKFFGEYPAWNFFARVWWNKEEEVFKAMIERYCSHIDTLEGETLSEIMEKASSLYGSD